MHRDFFYCLSLLSILFLPACTAKGYRGPVRSDNQVATIELKAPTLSKLPLFWIFPLNMVPWWFTEDWRETSWGPDIFVGNIELDDPDVGNWKVIASDKVKLDRYKTVTVLPGTRSVRTMQTAVINKEKNGDTTYEYGSCSCTGQEVNNQKQIVCEKKTTSWTPYRLTARDTTCTLEFYADPGQHYQAFIRNGQLMLQHSTGKIDDHSNCQHNDRSILETETSVSISSCSP